MVLISSGAVALVYLVGRKLFSERIALVAMLLTAVNPWQFMQSRWSLDCNLFPHIFLLGFYLLLLGLEKRRYLYLSMVFFGLTFYCCGIAAYSVTAFLFVFFIWCLWKRRLKFREGLLCALIFTVVALPEVIVLGINAVHFGRTISTPLFTMPYFPDSVRSADILLLNFSFAQLGKNAWALFSHVFLQLPDIFFNSIPAFGPLYHAEESREYYNKDFMEAVAEADSLEEYESLYITGNLGWQFNRDATEILTQYVCKIDAQYYQGKSNVSNGRELPAYADRYHYIYPEQQAAELVEMVGDGLLVLYQGDLQYIDFSYDVVDTVGDYLLLTVQN